MKFNRATVSAMPVAAAVLFSLGGCASMGGGALEPMNRDLLTRTELMQSSASNLYEAIERMRPLWLRAPTPRSFTMDTQIAVAQAGQYLGSIEILRGFSPDVAEEVRHLDASESGAALIGGLPVGVHIDSVIMILPRGIRDNE